MDDSSPDGGWPAGADASATFERMAEAAAEMRRMCGVWKEAARAERRRLALQREEIAKLRRMLAAQRERLAKDREELRDGSGGGL
jgi:hypothetical protein